MKMTSECVDGYLCIGLAGELDHHAAKEIMKSCAALIDERLPNGCVVDMQRVEFMDSSGIALLMNIYGRLRTIDASYRVINVNSQPMRVIDAAGLKKIISIKEADYEKAQ